MVYKKSLYGFLCRFIIPITATLTLAACSNNDDNNSSPPNPTITGLAATGGPLANATVKTKCSGGPLVPDNNTLADGTFSVELAGGQTLPCMLEVVSGTVTLHSFAEVAGHINVTPLTDLVITRALGSDAAAAFASFDASKGTSIKNGLDDAKAYVSTQVTAIIGGTQSGDPLTKLFIVGDDDDKVLENLKAALDANGKGLDDLRTVSVAGGSFAAAVPPGPQTWFFSDGAALTASQVTSFNTQGLYYNVHSAANPSGEIRGQIATSTSPTTNFVTDNGDLATSNTFSALLSGGEEVPKNASKASAYGTVVLDPIAKTITAVLVTNNINGILAHIHKEQPGVSGPIIFPLTGGPAVWTLPVPATPITDAQIADLRAGAYYLNVHTDALPAGELRGQLTQRVRFAQLSTANEPTVNAPAAPSSGVGVLALSPTANLSGNFPISGFVQTSGTVGAILAHIHDLAASTDGGLTGPVIVPIAETPAGSGHWVVPAGSTLTPAQVVSFNAGTLYYNVHTTLNPGGEIRGPIVPATVKIGNATLSGADEVPAVTTTASGTGIIALNDITRLVNGNIKTTGIIGILAHVHEAPVGVAGNVIVPLTLTPPVSTLPAPLVLSTTTMPGGTVNSPYSQSLAATGGTTPYTWAVTIGTLPAGLGINATTGLISGTPTLAGTSNFTVQITDSASPAATATMALSITVAAAAPASVSFAAQIQPIFAKAGVVCVGCHVTNGTHPDLTPANAFTSLTTQAALFNPGLGGPLVTAGNSAASVLFTRISSNDPAVRMPLFGAALSAADQLLIKNWIDGGAQP